MRPRAAASSVGLPTRRDNARRIAVGAPHEPVAWEKGVAGGPMVDALHVAGAVLRRRGVQEDPAVRDGEATRPTDVVAVAALELTATVRTHRPFERLICPPYVPGVTETATCQDLHL